MGMTLSSVIAAACSVAFSNAPSKLLVYSSSEWWSAGDKVEEMLSNMSGGLLDERLLPPKKLLALSNPLVRASRSALNFSLLL